jgi:two-component system, NtrC family, sensor kinase
MPCPRCQHENPTSQKFCGECGTSLAGPTPAGPPGASYADLQGEVERLARALSESLEQQTATSEILRVISSSPTDVQPVLEAVAESAARLCEAPDVSIFVQEADHLRVAARHGPIPSDTALPLSRESGVGWAVLAGQTVHVADMQTELDRFPVSVQNARRLGFRTALNVPLMRKGVAIGAISLRRAEAHLFAERQVALLETFADQAVIAIENVRLFTELEARNRDLTELLGQQTATAQILRVISSSPTDVQPVFDTIVRSALRLCNGATAAVFRVAGGMLHHPANYGGSPEALAVARARYPRPLGKDSIPGIAILTRSDYEVPDTEDPSALEMSRETGRILGIRGLLAVPMLHDGEAVGAIVVTRREPGRFAAPEVSLLKTFADQAVIAIENVRLFKELQEKNRELSEALDQQTATSDILRVLSSSPTEVQPVFDAIVLNASRLCGGEYAIVTRYDGEMMHLVAQHNPRRGAAELVAQLFPRAPARGSSPGRAILNRSLVHIPDALEDPEYDLEIVRAAGLRGVLSMPMFRDGKVIGAISVSRDTPGPFAPSQIELLKTFADQAVIAVENVRLFKELEARTADLTHSVEQLTALGEVGRAVSSTLDLETVLTTIVSRAVQLSGLDGGVVFEYEEGAEEFVQRAATETGGALAEARRTTRIRKDEGALGRTAITLEPVQVPDITVAGAHESRLRDLLIESGVRAILAVPMVREGHLIGCLGVTRNRPGEFPAETIELLRTFTTQSALAIQNARLFHEIEDKSRQLETASRHKSEFLANMSHELRTPLNAIIGFSEVLMQHMFGALNPKQDEYLRDIYDSGRHLLSLINDILDLSKIEAGRMELELTDFDLPTAIDSALTLVRERATRRGVALQEILDERVGPVRADERKVRQVVLNLLSNAIKFTPEGGRIEIHAVPGEGSIEVSVCDTGVGIAPEDQEAVFEEFRQVGTSAAKQEGTGLGLALCRKFVELHGGKIWVTSAVGTGSTFTFRLPVRPWPAS